MRIMTIWFELLIPAVRKKEKRKKMKSYDTQLPGSIQSIDGLPSSIHFRDLIGRGTGGLLPWQGILNGRVPGSRRDRFWGGGIILSGDFGMGWLVRCLAHRGWHQASLDKISRMGLARVPCWWRWMCLWMLLPAKEEKYYYSHNKADERESADDATDNCSDRSFLTYTSGT